MFQLVAEEVMKRCKADQQSSEDSRHQAIQQPKGNPLEKQEVVKRAKSTKGAKSEKRKVVPEVTQVKPSKHKKQQESLAKGKSGRKRQPEEESPSTVIKSPMKRTRRTKVATQRYTDGLQEDSDESDGNGEAEEESEDKDEAVSSDDEINRLPSGMSRRVVKHETAEKRDLIASKASGKDSKASVCLQRSGARQQKDRNPSEASPKQTRLSNLIRKRALAKANQTAAQTRR